MESIDPDWCSADWDSSLWSCFQTPNAELSWFLGDTLKARIYRSMRVGERWPRHGFWPRGPRPKDQKSNSWGPMAIFTPCFTGTIGVHLSLPARKPPFLPKSCIMSGNTPVSPTGTQPRILTLHTVLDGQLNNQKRVNKTVSVVIETSVDVKDWKPSEFVDIRRQKAGRGLLKLDLMSFYLQLLSGKHHCTSPAHAAFSDQPLWPLLPDEFLFWSNENKTTTTTD